MNRDKSKTHKWSEYLICLAPIPLIAYLGLESYGIDYRAFYLAGKSAIYGLNPYLNHVNISSDFYGPINAELARFSGWKYPPLATFVFAPFATLPYELSKNLFNLLSVAIAALALSAAIHISRRTIAPESILISAISFPVLATIERGQVEIILTAAGTGTAWLISRHQNRLAAIAIALMSSFKVYPILLTLGLLLRTKNNKRNLSSIIYLAITLTAIGAFTLVCTDHNWLASFIERAAIPFDKVPGNVLTALPKGTGIIEGTSFVQSTDARNLIHSHEFVFGFANPLLKRHTSLAALIGALGAALSVIINSKQSRLQRTLAIMPWINIANPLAWIMGLTWYIPLFIYSYGKLEPQYKILLILPLVLPPSLNASGYIAAAISLFISKAYIKSESLPSSIPQQALKI